MKPDPAGLGLQALLQANLAQHRVAIGCLDDLAEPIGAAALLMARTLAAGGRLLFFGNGGSCSDSQHIAAELTGRLRHDRRPLAALALTADSAALTAIGNDYGYDEVFARLLTAHARSGDVAIGISTSGRSPNVLRAFDAARALGAHCVGLLGRDGGAARAAVDVAVVVPHADSARIQEAHILIGHTWCDQIEALLGLARK